MCTLTLAWQVLSDAPVAVAANRDEMIDRPAEPPGRFANEPIVVAPRDVRAGGTWIGLNQHGVVAGVTNRWTGESLAGERSRGKLVADVLEAESATGAAALVETEATRREYEGFHLVVADADAAHAIAWDGSLEVATLDPGVHVVVNVGRVGSTDAISIPAHRPEIGAQQAANAQSVQSTLAPEGDEDATTWLGRASDVLADHEYGVCIHGDGYGTRSSTLVSIGGDAETAYRYAPGPPCQTAYEPVAAIDAVESHI